MVQPYKSICYCTNLRRSAAAISDFYDASLKSAGLTVAQYYLLVNLSRLETANITHWAEYVGLDRSTMVRNIKVLQAHDLIEIAEGRGKTFTLSPEGRRVLALATPLWENAQKQTESCLGKDNIEAIFLISEKLQELDR